ncbi:hypothetical protein FVA74_07580 [Salinibacterium sp. dk2585]|uniref:hypothetical protein n=1 Tax=unclassified Salinibacterium TaxID=2632331 RepID=UPI0011C245D0|nr:MULTISPECIES: hypothetical protein [unclassified Salinibacterium]QEE61452.1 hypothetical protein FVA74_07580 [Salinibacterium sp. dk2585]TXK54129.1 hypothetical protein FVP63_09030 [Salinibacterium sp. dk5596]
MSREHRMRRSGAKASVAIGLAWCLLLSACTASEQGNPEPSSLRPTATSETPGDPDYMPPASQACPFLIGEGGEGFAAFTGTDLGGLTIVDDVEELADSGQLEWMAPLIDHDPLVCLLSPGQASEHVAFAWLPIDEEQREQAIAELEAAGYERRDSEGGTEMTDPSGAAASHLVTNAGWYYSTAVDGARYLRILFED